MADQDTEITLGAGKLLGLFFLLAAVCGIFFAVGFSLGKTSAKEQALQERSAETHASASMPESSSGKPSAAGAMAAEPSSGGSEPAKRPEPDLTFYKSVKQNGQDTMQPPTPTSRAATGEVAPSSKPASSKNAVEARASAGPLADRSSARETTAAASGETIPAVSPGGTFLVQIAAVTHEEDAAALAGALRKKSYAAAVVNNPTGKDKLFHVVLGPYATLQDAEAMKIKLQGEGYNPIVKR